MNFKSIASVVAITSAMLLGGSAYAQTMFNGAELSADDLPKVQERCDQLNLASTNESLTDDAMGGETEGDTAGEADATIDSAEDVNEIANATSAIDLDLVTLDQCKEAGLVTAM